MPNKDNLSSIFYIAIIVLPIIAWFIALISDANNNRIGWVVVDILLIPLGILRGFYLWIF